MKTAKKLGAKIPWSHATFFKAETPFPDPNFPSKKPYHLVRTGACKEIIGIPSNMAHYVFSLKKKKKMILGKFASCYTKGMYMKVYQRLLVLFKYQNYGTGKI